ncbi:MAG: efflux RND transporter periplasmic adaptor subunit [Gemmatimonadales bacterium]
MIVSSRRLLVAAVVLAACGKAPAKAPAGGPGSGPQAIPVEVTAAFSDTVTDAIVATGQIEALQQIELRPDVEGRIVDLLFKEGARVAAGTPLVKIDDAELKSQVERARADRDLSKQSLERTRQLLAEKAAAPADLERAEATSRSSQASLDLLELRLARTVVRAPFAGVIGQRLVSMGDYVTSASRLLTLQTVSPQRITFTVPERYAGSLKVGQRVAFQVAAIASRTFEARVDFVDPVVTLPGRIITVKAVADNTQGILQPGMFIEARLATEVRPSAIIVPEEAISPTAGASYVWVVEGDKVARREVELGVRSPGFVEVRKGIDLGDRVVVGGLDRLSPGATVKTTDVVRRPQGARER